MVDYWPMNNNLDNIINPKNAMTAQYSSFIEDRFSNPNSAFYNDGRYYARFRYGSFQSSGTITIAMWLKLFDFTASQIIFSSSTYNSNLKIHYTDTGKIAVTDSASDGSIDSTTPIDSDKWYHIAFTVTGKEAKFYVNGSLTSSETWTNALAPKNGDYNYLAKVYGDYSYRYSKLAFSDLMLFNKALSSDEINGIKDLSKDTYTILN